MDVEAEIVELKRRVTTLENEVKANHDFSVKLFTYVREMRDDISLLREHAVAAGKHAELIEEGLGRLDKRVDRIEADLAALRNEVKELRSDLSSLRSEFNTFRKELPGMIAETMREVLREYRGR
jgi:chromosome segregation ATPase